MTPVLDSSPWRPLQGLNFEVKFTKWSVIVCAICGPGLMVAVFLLSLLPHAQAEEASDSIAGWNSLIRACGAWKEAHDCQNQADCVSWQWAASCALQTSGLKITPEISNRFNQCVDQIEAQREAGGPATACAACGHAALDAIGCTLGVSSNGGG
ncbi:MAG: hypothetical protein WB611_08465 [Stellaceae bacterium]